MTISTLAKLQAYANEKFREDYLRLPGVKIEHVNSDYTILRIEDQVDITVSPSKDLHFNPDQLRQLKPFCWVEVSFEQYQKMDALLTYYVMVKYEDVARVRTPYFTDDFRLACADVANSLRAAEAAVDGSSDRGNTVASQSQVQSASRTHHLPLPYTKVRQAKSQAEATSRKHHLLLPTPSTKVKFSRSIPIPPEWTNAAAGQTKDQEASRTYHHPSPSNILQPAESIDEEEHRIQEHQSPVQSPTAGNNTLQWNADTSQDKLTALENRISTLELASANEDLKSKLASAETRNEDLKAKIATADALIVKLAEENAELHRKMIWLPAPDVQGAR